MGRNVNNGKIRSVGTFGGFIKTINKFRNYLSSGFRKIKKQTFLLRCPEIRPTLTIRFYGKNAAGGYVIGPYFGKLVGKISEPGIVRKYSSMLELVIDLTDHIIKCKLPRAV